MVRWVRLVATGAVPSVLAATRHLVRSTATGDRLGPWAGALATGSSAVALTPTTGCATVPDVATGVTGTAAPGVDADDDPVGLIDAHAHLTASVALGGDLRCGSPFAPGGVEDALVGCASHGTLAPGVAVDRQEVGSKTYDLNVDGVAQYGLYADWVAHLPHRADAGPAPTPTTLRPS